MGLQPGGSQDRIRTSVGGYQNAIEPTLRMRRTVNDNGTSGFCLAHDEPFSNRFPLLVIVRRRTSICTYSWLCVPLGAFVKGKAVLRGKGEARLHAFLFYIAGDVLNKRWPWNTIFYSLVTK